MFLKYTYESVVDRFFIPGTIVGTVGGSLVGAYVMTDPRRGYVRVRDAFFGSLVGGGLGGLVGAIMVITHPIVLLSPLSLGPYMYNRSKMEKNTPVFKNEFETTAYKHSHSE